MAAPAGGRVPDTPKLEFKLHREFSVFCTRNFNPSWYRRYNLVASSPQHVFVASTDGLLTVYRVGDLLYKADPKRVSRVNVELPEKPLRIAVNCDGDLLAVVGDEKSILIYNVKDFWNLDASPMLQDASPKLSVPRGSSKYVSDMQWSPSMRETLAIGFGDKITTLHVGTGKRDDNNSVIRCLSWSPSGSRLVVGHADGTLSVYSPDLSQRKRIPAPDPPLFDGATLWARAVHWTSNNQFAVIYYNYSTDGRKSAYTLINVPDPEGESPRAEYVARLESDLHWPHYNLLPIKPWNAMLFWPTRKAVVKLLPADSDGGDSQAPVHLLNELPHKDYKDDLYPVGVALNRSPVLRLSSQSHLHETTDETVTLLHVLTRTGFLATYTVGERPSTPSVGTERRAAEQPRARNQRLWNLEPPLTP